MKTFFLGIFTTIILLLLFQIPHIFKIYELKRGLSEYVSGNFIEAKNIFTQYQETEEGSYHLGLTNYRLGDFTGALEGFRNISSYSSLHNKGNTEYYLGLQESEKDKKIQFWEQSLLSYTGGYSQSQSKETKANYDFVEKKLQELKNPPKSQNESSSDGDNKEKEGNTKDESENKNGGESQKESEKSGGNSGTNQNDAYKMDEGDTVGKISPSEAKIIEEYIKKLEQSQENNQQYFNKNSQNSSFFDQFFEPLGGTQEKDW